MAAIDEGTTQLLDQLENEVNRVMEQMGRLFDTANKDPKAASMQAAKLRQIVPNSSDNFHAALDQFEHELQLANLVMRRDLALCRERDGSSKPGQMNGTVSVPDAEKTQAISNASNKPDTKLANDTTIQDAQTSQDVEMADAPTAGSAPIADEPSQADTQADDAINDVVADQIGDNHDEPTSNIALKIDTNAQSKGATDGTNQAEDENPPDTGTFTNDFDSLFGGPTSAEPRDGGEFNMNTNNSNEFDFGSFGANLDNNGAENDDNIASLLPGLQDYANNPHSPAHASDFDNIFDLNSVPVDGQQVQQASELDDMLDFDDLIGGDYGNGGGNNSHDANATSTDFDFSFD